MKLLLTTLLFLFHFSIYAHSNAFADEYNRIFNKEGDHLIEYKLTLN